MICTFLQNTEKEGGWQTLISEREYRSILNRLLGDVWLLGRACRRVLYVFNLMARDIVCELARG